MSEIIALLIQFLPAQIAKIKYLQYVPDAAATVKELVGLVQRAIKTIQTHQTPRTEGEEKILDDAIAALSSDPYWEPDVPTVPPGK